MQKTCSAKENSKKTPNTQRQKGFDEKKIKIEMSTNHQTKENILNQIKEIENNLKISMNPERNLRETRAIAAIKNNPKYFYKFIKNNSKIKAGIGPLHDEEGNLEPSNKKMSELLNEQ